MGCYPTKFKLSHYPRMSATTSAFGFAPCGPWPWKGMLTRISTNPFLMNNFRNFECLFVADADRLRSRPPLFNRGQNFRHHFALWLRALRTLAVETDAHCASFQVAAADDEHGVDAQLFRVRNLRLERRRAEIRVHAHHV